MNLEQLKIECNDFNEVKWLIDEYSTGLKSGREFSVMIHTTKNKWLVQHFDKFGNSLGRPHVAANINHVAEHYY